jgi:hypothetical protein
MNIFFLDSNTHACAKYHCDKHVVKMILEYAQLLSTAHWECDGQPAINNCYKPTHKNHPSAVWVRQSAAHYDWLYNLLWFLTCEYTRRYGKIHATYGKGIVGNLGNRPYELPDYGWVCDPPQCMPDKYKVDKDTIKAYRNYYLGDKARFATWKTVQKPTWFNI